MDMALSRRPLTQLPCSYSNGESLASRFPPPKFHKHFSPPLRYCPFLLLLLLLAAFLLFPPFSTHSLQGRHRAAERDVEDDTSLGGLLSDEIDRVQCRSRGVIYRYRHRSEYKPSPYLVARLRKYEELHRKCAPGTANFNRSIDLLKHQATVQDGEEDKECKYVVWIAYSGLGNKLVSISSTFVYALLTNRVLLLDEGHADLGELFCEPFPGASWLLSSHLLPFSLDSLNESSPLRFGHLLEHASISPIKRFRYIEKPLPVSPAASPRPSPLFAYIHLTHNYDFYDQLLFCEPEQASLHRIPWWFLKSNQYFVPSLYIYLPHFREELDRLFPQREAIFHHIGRYLFYPTNSVWSWIMRFHHAYLAKASQRVGIQIRTFVSNPVVLPHVTQQILTCAVENNVLPKPKIDEEGEIQDGERNSTALLVTSLLPDYSEQIRAMYADHSTETGDFVSVHQPSHEIHQQTQKQGHNKKAWAEICLLSFSDKLITSPASTFGYVAHGLAGIKPWILANVENGTVPSPACSRTPSIDPCFHAPPYYDCINYRGGDTSEVLPFIKHCEDVRWGLKIFQAPDS